MLSVKDGVKDWHASKKASVIEIESKDCFDFIDFSIETYISTLTIMVCGRNEYQHQAEKMMVQTHHGKQNFQD